MREKKEDSSHAATCHIYETLEEWSECNAGEGRVEEGAGGVLLVCVCV